MVANLLETVDFLRDELHEFYRVLRRGGTEGTEAAVRLRAALSRVEPVVNRARGRADFTVQQRWGYVELECLLETAHHELQQRNL
jgi:hypothetical protein